jgi:hypothetical protein
MSSPLEVSVLSVWESSDVTASGTSFSYSGLCCAVTTICSSAVLSAPCVVVDCAGAACAVCVAGAAASCARA